MCLGDSPTTVSQQASTCCFCCYAGMQARHRHLIALSASSTPGSGSPSSNQQLVQQPSFSTPDAGIGKNPTVKDIEAAVQNAGDSNNNNTGGSNKDWLPLVSNDTPTHHGYTAVAAAAASDPRMQPCAHVASLQCCQIIAYT